MEAIFKIQFGVAILLTIILGGVRPGSITKYLDKCAKRGRTIDGIFKPSKDGFLGSGSYGLTYKGQFLPRNNTEVAMKFAPIEEIHCSNNEYKMYTYLDAITNQSAEAYGIPTIYYYGKWNNHTMLAMKLLDTTFQKRFEAGEFDEWNLLIAFREFVKIIKYIHSRGIVHNDTKIENIIIENGQGFIFDFGTSLDMTMNCHEGNIAQAKYDFRKFLNSVFRFVQLTSDWRWLGFGDSGAYPMTDLSSFVAKLETNGQNGNTGLRRVLVEFWKHSLSNQTGVEDADGTWIPFYDQLYRVIIEEMKSCEINATSSYSSLSHIPDPFGWNDWSRPTMDYESFENLRTKWNEENEKTSKSIDDCSKYLCWR